MCSAADGTQRPTTTHDGAASDGDAAHVAAIRADPAAYVGHDPHMAVLHLLAEVLAYAVDEAAAGSATRIDVTVHPGGRLSVQDDGRGTAVTVDRTTGAVRSKPIMTSPDLRFFGCPTAPILATGLPRRGISVVNALSEELVHTSRRGELGWSQSYRQGLPTGPAALRDAVAPGTLVSFLPDRATLASGPLSLDRLRGLLRHPTRVRSGLEMALRVESATSPA